VTDRSPDLADLVQAMRRLLWRSAFLASDDKEGWLTVAFTDWKRPDTLRAAADRLRPVRPDLADEWAFLADAFTTGPRAPTDDELIHRYVAGGIGDRTVLWITGWDHRRLMDECLARGLPPMQVPEEDMDDD
jgi:hypothetical protein